MNKDRRHTLRDIVLRLMDIRTELEAVRDEEQDYYDNMPESLQGGEKGDAATEVIDTLTQSIDNIIDAEMDINAAIGE